MTLDGVNWPLSGNASIDGFIWQEHPSYASEIPFKNYIDFSFDTNLLPDAVRDGSHLMTPDQQQDVRNALNYVSQVTGVTFNEVPAGASADTDLIFAYKEMGQPSPSPNPAAAMDYYTYNYTAASPGVSASLDMTDSILLNSNRADLVNPIPGTPGYEELLREIGHALGLKDPGDPPIAAPGLSDGNGASIMTAEGDPILTAYTPSELTALNWLYGGKGLVNTGQTPTGGSSAGAQMWLDQFSQSGVMAINS